MIYFDKPRPAGFRSYKRTSHMSSDLPGADGTRELLEFATRIGLRGHWIQKPGEPTEHFDLFDAAIERARLAGAEQVSAREFIDLVVRPKREAAKAQPSKAGGQPSKAGAACRSCGKPVEEAREVYAIPTCNACLPPPEALPVARLRSEVAGG